MNSRLGQMQLTPGGTPKLMVQTGSREYCAVFREVETYQLHQCRRASALLQRQRQQHNNEHKVVGRQRSNGCIHQKIEQFLQHRLYTR